MSNRASANITLHKVRNGKTINLYLSATKSLTQVVSRTASGALTVTPNYTVAANRPTITPIAANAVLTSHSWRYSSGTGLNGIVFSSSTHISTDGKFKLNPDTGAITIIKNLASDSNVSSDTLEYTALATINGIQSQVSATINVEILLASSSEYTAFVTADSDTVLSDDHTQVTLSASLTYGGQLVDLTKNKNITAKWLKNGVAMSGKTSTQLVVTRDDVDNQSLFVCQFYNGSTLIEGAGRVVSDKADLYAIGFVIQDGSGKEIGNNIADNIQSASVVASIYDRNNSKLTPSGVKWTMRKMYSDDFTLCAGGTSEVTSNTIVVADADYQHNGKSVDVSVSADVEW